MPDKYLAPMADRVNLCGQVDKVAHVEAAAQLALITCSNCLTSGPVEASRAQRAVCA